MIGTRDDRLVEVASAWTAQGAAGVVEFLERRGIRAQVRMNDPLLGGGCGFWPIAVLESDAAHAREALTSDDAFSAGRIDLRHCPECQYSLDGLAAASRCPECGQDLDEAKARLSGVLIREADCPSPRSATRMSVRNPGRAIVGVVLGIAIVAGVWLIPAYYLAEPSVVLPGAGIALLVLGTLWRIKVRRDAAAHVAGMKVRAR